MSLAIFWGTLITLIIIILIVIISIRVSRIGIIKKRVRPKEYTEYTISQFFFLLSIFFLGLTLLFFNRSLGDPLSWRTILFLVSVIGLVIAYYFKIIYAFIVSLVELIIWWGSQSLEWVLRKDIKDTILIASFLFIGAIFYLLGRVHEKEMKFKRISIIYLTLGLIFINFILLFYSTKVGLDLWTDNMERVVYFVGSWEITFSIFILFIFFVGLLVYTLRKKLIFEYEATAIGFLVVLFLIIPLLPEIDMFEEQYSPYLKGYFELSELGILWATFFNILIFFETFGIILLGYFKKDDFFINAGLFFMLILIFVKYFDWFFAFLDKSVFFIGAGVLLLVVGFFMEKGKRYLRSGIKKDIVNQNQ